MEIATQIEKTPHFWGAFLYAKNLRWRCPFMKKIIVVNVRKKKSCVQNNNNSNKEKNVTRLELKREIKKNDAWKIVSIVMAIAFFVVATMLVKEKSYWQGYNEAYDTGVKNGWQSCIEENNLYERYK